MIVERTELSTLVNIGTTIEKRLNDIGIYSREELEKMGVVEAWRRIRHRYPKQNLSARYYLFSMQGALIDVRRTQLPPHIRNQLKTVVHAYN
ncbi:TfoX/Sxy family DNA transformation protein [Anaerolineales bacterium HSG24]|nr:TfoX/Sxy family DNA transformation protein [Anaerolineales bacterium HSG24]